MTTERPTRKVWIVVCGSWSYNDEFESGGESPIKAFTSREKAEAYIRAWEEYHATPAGGDELNFSQTDVNYQIVETDVEMDV